MNPYVGKTPEELESVKKRAQDSLDEILVTVALSESIPGRRWLKMLQEDLAAVRAKYAFVKGTAEERLTELSKLQGKDEQLRSEIDLISNAESYHKRLLTEIEFLTEASKIQGKKKEGR